jgi:hypothetical protein
MVRVSPQVPHTQGIFAKNDDVSPALLKRKKKKEKRKRG